MSNYHITKVYTPAGSFITGLWLAALVAVVGVIIISGHTNSESEYWLLILLCMGILTALVLWPLRKQRLINHRQSKLFNYAALNKLEYSPGFSKEIMYYGLMSLADLRKVRDREYRNLVSGPEWQYCDFSYKLYEKTKYGEYHTATVHYGIMTTTLPRILPNVFFDSLKARRRQFRWHFSRDQRHSLEGDFDQHFVTYFPKQYTIDSMSFISPDVMEALIAANDYDIEIVGDRIYLYGALADPDVQLPEMSRKLAVIKKQLLDNILTYRDERIPFAEGRQKVAMIGLNLSRSKLLQRLTLAFIILYVLGFISIRVWSDFIR